MIDICKYINSKDIRAYLREINYKFNVKEALFIISRSYILTLEEKEKLIKEVMEEYHDEPFKDHKSLFDIVKINIQRRKEYLDFFINDKESYVYTFRIFYKDYDDYDAGVNFSSFDELKKYLINHKNDLFFKNWNDDDVEFSHVYVEKNKIDSERYAGSVYLNEELEIIDVNLSCDLVNYSVGNELTECESEDITMEFFLEIPTPFKKGDILVHISKKDIDYMSGPFVLDTKFEELKEKNIDINILDESDMQYTGYFIEKDGNIYHDHSGNYLSFEYYRDDFDNYKRELIAISNLLKGEIDLALFYNGIKQIQFEEEAKKHKRNMYLSFDDNGLKLCGILDDDD